jgi:hypothetical protein
MKDESKNMTRRSFIGTTGAVAAGLTIIPGSVLSGMGKSAVRQAEYCRCRYRRNG